MFSVNALVYGKHPDLAERCVGSIHRSLDPALVAEVRVGMNAACPETRDVVLGMQAACPVPFYVYEEVTGANVMKYPLMRRMLYDPVHSIPHPRVDKVMWFDDDSCVVNGNGFFARAAAAFAAGGSPLMGAPYHAGYRWTDTERAAFAAQPWFTGQPLSPMPLFITGGWWVADLEFLAKWDYPFRELRHNGGDVLLGEVLRQQGRKPHEFRAGVAINADAMCRESSAKRRGLTTRRPFERPPPYDYRHHDFEVRVTCNSRRPSGST